MRSSCPTHLEIGHFGHWLWPKPYRLSITNAQSHAHVIGVSGSGKSRFLAGFYLGLLKAGLPATLIDPHGDLAHLILGHLAAAGAYADPATYDRLLYLDIPAAERAGRFLPLNVLAGQGQPHTIASNVKEAFHRAYPQLAGGAAPMFDTLVQDGVKVLVSNALPLTGLFRLLTDTGFRNGLLQREADGDVVAFFRDQYDRLPPRDQADQAGAALRRAHLLTFAPVLKYSLGQPAMALDFRRILDARQSVIINLALADAEARRLLGCLITVAAEQGALSRAEQPSRQRHGSHHLLIDEFSEFTAQSEEALSRMLSQTRKFGLFLVMAHQTWSQASARLRGALQNVGIEAVFRLGRDDAEHAARILGRVDPRSVSRRTEGDTEGVGMGEQWERFTQEIQDLPNRKAFLKTPQGTVTKVTARSVPDPIVDSGLLAEIEARYLERYFTPMPDEPAASVAATAAAGTTWQPTTRTEPLDDDSP